MSFTVDVHHHILPDVFWRAMNDAHNPVGGILAANVLKLLPRLAARVG
jgi:6-methylsalicylate decarboxylase